MNKEEIRILAEEHWKGFTGGLLEIALPDPVPKEVVLKLAMYLNKTVWIHAIKHEREDAEK